MKNVVLKVALGLSLASAVALAQGAFVGFEGDYSFNSNLTAKSDNGKSKAKKAQPGLGIKAGYDFDVARVYGADYTPSVAKDLKLVLGGYTGFSKLKMDVFDTHDGSEKGNATGWILGARVGAEYSINENNAVEFGLKADRTKYRSIAKYDNAKIKETNVGLYMGYTYKF